MEIKNSMQCVGEWQLDELHHNRLTNDLVHKF